MKKYFKRTVAFVLSMTMMLTASPLLMSSAHSLKPWAENYKVTDTNPDPEVDIQFAFIGKDENGNMRNCMHIKGDTVKYYWGNSTDPNINIKNEFQAGLNNGVAEWVNMIHAVETNSLEDADVVFEYEDDPQTDADNTIACTYALDVSNKFHYGNGIRTRIVLGYIAKKGDDEYKGKVFAHELGHLWGIEDLYNYRTDLESIYSDASRFDDGTYGSVTRSDRNAMRICQENYWYEIKDKPNKYQKAPRTFATNEWYVVDQTLYRFDSMGYLTGETIDVSDGTFVRYNEDIFRMAGGAPIICSAAFWATMNTNSYVQLTQEQYNGLRQYPEDGTVVRTASNGACYRIAGGAPVYISSFDNLPDYTPNSLVNIDAYALDYAGEGGVLDHLRQYPKDGTCVCTANNDDCYYFAYGAPLYINSFQSMLNQPTAVTPVDDMAIQNAGTGGVWNHVRKNLQDGTILRDDSGDCYRLVGGAPIYISSFDKLPDYVPGNYIDVPENVILSVGDSDEHGHLRRYPADGSLVKTASDGAYYCIVGGAPICIQSLNRIPGASPDKAIYIDDVAITNANHGAWWDHLLQYPKDGTLLYSRPEGYYYRVAGGAPINIGNFQNIPDITVDDAVDIDQAAISNIGNTENIWKHLRQYPEDNTFLCAKGLIYRIAGGSPLLVYDMSDVGNEYDPDSEMPHVWVDESTIKNAGNGAPWNHLRKDPANGTYVSTNPLGGPGEAFRFYNTDINIAQVSYNFNYTRVSKKALFGRSFATGYPLTLPSISQSTVTETGILPFGSSTYYYAFTAPRTGSYVLKSTACTGDVYGELYNSSKTRIVYNDDGNGNRNFKITYSLTAGQTYYLRVRNFSSTATTTGAYTLSIQTP